MINRNVPILLITEDGELLHLEDVAILFSPENVHFNDNRNNNFIHADESIFMKHNFIAHAT